MAAIPSKHPMGFKSALRPLLQFSQIIGILPVEEINYRNTKTIRFRWKSRKVFYTCFLITVSGTMVLLSAVRVLRSGISLGTTGDFIFYSCTTAVMVLFLRLATKWPDLMSQWGFTEETMMADHQSDISRTIHLVSVVVLILSLVEHLSANLVTLLNGIRCYSNFWSVIKFYYTNAFKQVFSLTEFSPLKGVLCSLIVLMSTLAWNCMDLMIIIISLALRSKIQDFNYTMSRLSWKSMYFHDWKKSRQAFDQLSLLTKACDYQLSPLVLLSFASNLYFICFQLLHSLKPFRSITEEIYFILSFSYLLFRTCAVSLCAASIHTNSRNSLHILFSVSSERYNIEVERLITQMSYDELALTGCKFFTITRTLILTVAGTIITYEIILIQLNGDNAELNTTALNVTCPDLK